MVERRLPGNLGGDAERPQVADQRPSQTDPEQSWGNPKAVDESTVTGPW